MKKKILIMGSLCILVTGCSRISRPPPISQIQPHSTRSGIAYTMQGKDFSHDAWWKKLHDPVLNQLIHLALIHNNQIKNAHANVLQARAKLKEAHFAWLPTLNASLNGIAGGGWDSNMKPVGHPSPLTAAFSNIGAIHFRGYYTGFVPQYSLNFLQTWQKEKYARASLAVQCATYQSTRLSVISQVTGSYFMLLGQKQQLQEQLQLLHDIKAMRALESARYHHGISDLSTVISYDKQIANYQANITTVKNSIAQNENALQVLINRNPASMLTKKNINQISVTKLIPQRLSSSVLKNRPDVITARANLKMTEANLGIAYSNFFPQINLTGILGAASFELSHLLSLSTGLWVAEGIASVPAFNGVYYTQIKEAKAGYYAAYYNYLQTLRSVFADVDNSLTNQQQVNAAYLRQSQALHAADRSYQLSLARYRAGTKDYREVINAAITRDNARLDLNQAKMQQLDGIVTVYQAVAGGYKQDLRKTSKSRRKL